MTSKPYEMYVVRCNEKKNQIFLFIYFIYEDIFERCRISKRTYIRISKLYVCTTEKKKCFGYPFSDIVSDICKGFPICYVASLEEKLTAATGCIMKHMIVYGIT